MYREPAERRLIMNHGEDDYLFPASEYSISNVPETTLSVLDESFDQLLPADVFDGVSTTIETVLLLVLDGYGLNRWKQDYPEDPFLSRLTDRGSVTPLTSVYPSETAAALTTLYTGLEPAEHGVLGWYQYIESVGEDIVTLPFTNLEGVPLSKAAPDTEPHELFEGVPLSVQAAETGIDVHAILPDAYVDSSYSRAVTAKAERTGYDTIANFASSIRQILENASGPTFVHAYQPNLDEIAHREGTRTDRYRTNLEEITDCLRRELLEELEPATAERTLLVVTADHGFVNTEPEENVDLVSQEWWPTLEETFRHDGRSLRLPTGSPRNTHFHIQANRLEDAREILESEIDGRVFTRVEALEKKLFGSTPSELFRRRCGDLVAVHRNCGLCWHDHDREMVGMHGGLTPEEMLVPVAIGRLDTV